MTTMQPQGFQKAKHIYSVKLIDERSEPRIYRVKITGAANRDFFVAITPSQNARNNVEKAIEEWCERNFDKLPKDNSTLPVDLNENRKE
jgi:hypothetical protein